MTTDTATAIVAASVLTISIGSISVAFNVISDDLGGITGAGEVFWASGVEPDVRLETGELEAGESVECQSRLTSRLRACRAVRS